MWHIIPVNDLEEHEMSSTCKCHPELQESDGFLFLVHNSFDGREHAEQLIDKAKQSFKLN
jgi:hypothetical protein